MRKLLLLALLVTTAPPALAAADDTRDRRSARIEARAERAERAARAPDVERAPRPAPAVERPRPRGDGGRRADVSERRLVERPEGAPIPVSRRGWLGREPRGVAPGGFGARPETPDSVRDWRRGERTGRDRPGTIDEGTALPTNRPVADSDRRGDHRRWRDGRNDGWRHSWRHDRRYDWRDHRRRHRSIFRLGAYFDPFGWGYNRFSIGSRLYPHYYRSSYWLNDPWQYRLPPAYGRYRWVRYYDDALLIDVYSGEVVDVIHQFFW